MIRIKLATGDDWTIDRGRDYGYPNGDLNVHDESGQVIASVAASQWIYVEIAPES